MQNDERERREATFAGAKAAILGCRPQLAKGVKVVRIDGDEQVLRYPTATPDAPLGFYEAQFMRLINGRRTVGEIIEAIADDLDIPRAMEAGKASMAALHVYYVNGAIEELRGL